MFAKFCAVNSLRHGSAALANAAAPDHQQPTGQVYGTHAAERGALGDAEHQVDVAHQRPARRSLQRDTVQLDLPSARAGLGHRGDVPVGVRLGGGQLADLRSSCDWTHPLAMLAVAAMSMATTPLVPLLALVYSSLAGYTDVVELRRLRRPLPTPDGEQLAAKGGAILAWRSGARVLMCVAIVANAALLAWPAGLQGHPLVLAVAGEEGNGAEASSLARASVACGCAGCPVAIGPRGRFAGPP